MAIFSSFFRERKILKTPTATDIAIQIQQLLPNVHSGTLRFWGVWFGRPYDNCHTIVKAESNGDCLILHFNDDEILQVWHPQACQIDSTQFVIGLASRVLWQWHWYGRPHTPGNLLSHDFVRNETEITLITTEFGRPATSPSFNESAVQIY